MSARAAPEWSAQDVVRYFEVAGPDYAAWSPSFNMHFGYWARGMSFLARRPMLERMSAETLARLAAQGELPPHLADLGCGLGATARHCARRSTRFLRGDFGWPRERWQNMIGPFFGAFLGLHRWRFGYYLVSATRAGLRP